MHNFVALSSPFLFLLFNFVVIELGCFFKQKTGESGANPELLRNCKWTQRKSISQATCQVSNEFCFRIKNEVRKNICRFPPYFLCHCLIFKAFAMGIFDKRLNYKPFEYPEVMQFVDSMNNSFWVHKEIDFTADIQDFKANLSDLEQEIVKRSLLSIAQVEVGVKLFWGDLYRHFPKPELNNLGATFAECEVRHGEAYARLLEVLGFNKDFENLVKVPVFQKKLELIDESLNPSRDVISKLLFFTIVIENSSLFSQFANVLSFTRFKGYLKNTSNIIAWTSIDEQNHADAGVYLLNKLDSEGYLTQEIKNNLATEVKKYIEYEADLLDWIYECGELDFFSKEDMLNFMKYRVDDSLQKIGVSKLFNITVAQYQPMMWFDEEIFANELDDFFAKRPTAYTKHDKSIHAEDLF